MGKKLYLVLVKEDDLRLFTSYPQKVKEPIMVESKEEEQDYHGHFYHPYINSGKYREVWKSGKYNNGIHVSPSIDKVLEWLDDIQRELED